MLRLLRTNPRRNPARTLTWQKQYGRVVSEPLRMSVDGVPAALHFEISTVGGWGGFSAVLIVEDPDFATTHPAAHARLDQLFTAGSSSRDRDTYYNTYELQLEDVEEAKREARAFLSELRAHGFEI